MQAILGPGPLTFTQLAEIDRLLDREPEGSPAG